MKLLLAFVGFWLLSIASAAAQGGCEPPAGMSIQQWYGVCGQALQQAYSAGMGQGAPFQTFVQSMYQVYARPVQNFSGGGQAGNLCELGSSECFNGYARTCQRLPTGGTWWVTSSQQCR